MPCFAVVLLDSTPKRQSDDNALSSGPTMSAKRRRISMDSSSVSSQQTQVSATPSVTNDELDPDDDLVVELKTVVEDMEDMLGPEVVSMILWDVL